jgi:hypothetical protein
VMRHWREADRKNVRLLWGSPPAAISRSATLYPSESTIRAAGTIP